MERERCSLCSCVVVCGFLLTLASTTITEQIYCVMPDVVLRVNEDASNSVSEGRRQITEHGHESQCTETMTWNEYLARQEVYIKSDVSFLFLQGVHYMNRSLNASNVTNLRIYGNSSLPLNEPVLYTSAYQSTPFIFSSFSHVTVEALTFRVCVLLYDSEDFSAVLFFDSGSNMTVKNVKFSSTCNGSYITAMNVENITVEFVEMDDYGKMNNSCGDICFPDGNVSGSIEICSVHFVFFGGTNNMQQFSSIKFGDFVNSATILIDQCSFSCKSPLSIYLGNASLTLNRIQAVGCHSNYMPAFSIQAVSGNCYITNSRISGYNSAVLIFNWNTFIEVRNCWFSSNTVSTINNPLASALTIIEAEAHRHTFYSIVNVMFMENGKSISYSFSNVPTLTLILSMAHIIECQFLSNHGNALYVYHSKVKLMGFIYFCNNTDSGHGIYNQPSRVSCGVRKQPC